MTTALFWVITQREVVIPYPPFGQLISPYFKGQELLTLPNLIEERC
jgi:hypothetical protein